MACSARDAAAHKPGLVLERVPDALRLGPLVGQVGLREKDREEVVHDPGRERRRKDRKVVRVPERFALDDTKVGQDWWREGQCRGSGRAQESIHGNAQPAKLTATPIA